MEGDTEMPVEPEAVTEEDPMAYLEETVGKMFGPAGKFIVQKQVEMYLDGRPLTEEDIPEVIDKITAVIGPLLGANLTKEFRQEARRHFGLPI